MAEDLAPMKVRVKLYAMLSDYLPPEARRNNALDLELPEGTTVAAIIKRFALPAPLTHLVLVNGQFVAPDQRAARTLVDGDALAIWPPVAGG